MDFIKKVGGQALSGSSNNNNNDGNSDNSSGGNLMNKLNSMAGGGQESEKNEDLLDKGVDLVQEHILKQGDQSNESAVEQAKDEQISDFIRDKYKSATGSDFPIKDKDTKLGM